MNTNILPAGSKTGYQGYWPDHLEGLEFEAEICRGELVEQAQAGGIALTESELDEMVETEERLWGRKSLET